MGISMGGKGEADAACSTWPCGKYTTTFPFLGKLVRGPAQACQSSIYIDGGADSEQGEDEPEAPFEEGGEGIEVRKQP